MKEKLTVHKRVTEGEAKLIDVVRALQLDPEEAISRVYPSKIQTNSLYGKFGNGYVDTDSIIRPDLQQPSEQQLLERQLLEIPPEQSQEKPKSNYVKLKEAGYTTAEARRYRNNSKKRIQELIEQKQNPPIPDKKPKTARNSKKQTK